VGIIGAHVLLYTPEPDRLRETFRDVFGWKNVDAGEGWLIFALPPAEVGVHPSEGSTHHELSLICDDVQAAAAQLESRGIELRGEPADLGFGTGVTLVLPGGVEVLLYEPRHPTALDLDRAQSST
jgi:catechol 2,3-dioxygenase-like lactoylglutathione lyase family enzyme